MSACPSDSAGKEEVKEEGGGEFTHGQPGEIVQMTEAEGWDNGTWAHVAKSNDTLTVRVKPRTRRTASFPARR